METLTDLSKSAFCQQRVALAANFLAWAIATTVSGADDAKSPAASKFDQPVAERKPVEETKPEGNSPPRQRQGKQAPRPKSAVPDRFPADMDTGMIGVNIDEGRAVQRVGSEIRQAHSLRPTLVVWLMETSSAAESLRRGSIDPISQLLQQFSEEGPEELEMAAIGYAADVRWAAGTPTKKPDELKTALAGMAVENSDRVNLFGAVRQAVEKFAARKSSGWEVIFVVVGASAGDDLNDADSVLLALKRAAIPVFGIGPAARFGPTVAQTVRGRTEREARDERTPSESLFAERIRLALPGQQGTADLGDAGYGPFGLERLCRQSGGRYLRLRDVAMTGWEIDPATGDIKAELLERYAPDYVNDEHYRQLLAENRCRLALHNAAQLPAQVGLEVVSAEFTPTSDEARLANEITTKQQAAAIKDQPIQQLYDALAAGESDRAKLQGARWQAAYDLAMGQAMAAKARLDGYNAMLATLKQGKKFTNPESKRWVLEPADEIAAGSALDKMAKNSRVYLKRVTTEHKGTPWAAIAERELQHPAGWKFVEK